MPYKVAIAELKKDIQYIKEAVDVGFANMIKRQDTTNGRLKEHDKSLTELNDRMNNTVTKQDCGNLHNSLALEVEKNGSSMKEKVLFYLLGIIGTIATGFILKFVLKI